MCEGVDGTGSTTMTGGDGKGDPDLATMGLDLGSTFFIVKN
jgi:hypothetical protein